MMKKLALTSILFSVTSLLGAGCVGQDVGSPEDEVVSEGAAALSTTVPAVTMDKTRFSLGLLQLSNSVPENTPFYPGSSRVTYNLPCDFYEVYFGAVVNYNDTGPTLYVKETFTAYNAANNSVLLTHAGIVTHLDAHTSIDFGQPMFFSNGGSYPTTLIPLDSLVRVSVKLETFLTNDYSQPSGSPAETTDFWMRRNCSCSN
jgi:hypothetical protein